ncbi:hypothetical protein D3C87_30510 [compost metagenome]
MKTVLVSIKFEYEGTIMNHAFLVENQFIPTVNNKVQNHPIELNGDPIELLARFSGAKGTVLKSFELQINGITGYKLSDIEFKTNGLEIKVPIPYSNFNLK